VKRLALVAMWLAGCTSDVTVLSWRADAGSADAGQLDAGTPPIVLGAAFDHTCAAEDGELYCWGNNHDGQLGIGDTAEHLTPQHVTLDARVVATCAGEAHSCALADDRSLYCWGKNLHGELGVSDFAAREQPARVEGIRFARIACGGYGSCGIREDGALFCWGDNFEGKLGQDDSVTSPDASAPREVAAGTAFYDVSVGQGHVCAVTRDGALYCWGRNSDGQLGTGEGVEQLRRPTRVGTASDYRAVAAGQHHSCALRTGGTLWCWGTDTDGVLGLDVANGTRVTSPVEVKKLRGFSSVSANWFHSCALTSDGALYCWGRNAEGQLGLGDTLPRTVPTRVGSASDWLAVTAGHFHSCALATGGVWCWGENDELHQLGIGAVGRKSAPTQVALP
jgi:alpha-tubulin suppressor-like RCC1 family protein